MNPTVDQVPAISLQRIQERQFKRPLDLTILVLIHAFPPMLLLWLFLWLVIPILIWLDDRGPIFYRQSRIGKNGRPFTVLKFRTMVRDADKKGPAWTVENDPRVTRLGRILRRTALDELPQVLSIWKGDMSLVGPRPEVAERSRELESDIPYYNARYNIKPGMTGLSQVRGLRGDTDLSLRVIADLEYLENWSIWLDLYILLRTLLAFRNAS